MEAGCFVSLVFHHRLTSDPLARQMPLARGIHDGSDLDIQHLPTTHSLLFLNFPLQIICSLFVIRVHTAAQKKVCYHRLIMLQYLDRLNTYLAIYGGDPPPFFERKK